MSQNKFSIFVKKIFLQLNLEVLKTIDFYKESGILEFVKQIFIKMGFECYRRSLIIIKLDILDIQNNNNEATCFDLATIDDIKNQQQFDIGYFNKSRTIERLIMGKRLFIVKENKKIVFALWVEQKNASFWWLNKIPLDLPKDTAYVSAIYTSPEYRNKGLYRKVHSELYPYLKKEGFNHLISTIHPNNTLSIQIHKNIGWKEYQIINYNRFFHIKYYVVQKFNSNERKKFITFFKGSKDVWKTYLST